MFRAMRLGAVPNSFYVQFNNIKQLIANISFKNQ